MPNRRPVQAGFGGLFVAFRGAICSVVRMLAGIRQQNALDKALHVRFNIFTFRSGMRPSCPNSPTIPRQPRYDGTAPSTRTPKKCATSCSSRMRSSIPAISCRSSTRCCGGVRKDGASVSQSAAQFGLTRPTWYQAKKRLRRWRAAGAGARQAGAETAPQAGAEVVEALRAARTAQPDLRSGELVALVRDQFGLAVHRRSVERALARKKK